MFIYLDHIVICGGCSDSGDPYNLSGSLPLIRLIHKRVMMGINLEQEKFACIDVIKIFTVYLKSNIISKSYC